MLMRLRYTTHFGLLIRPTIYKDPEKSNVFGTERWRLVKLLSWHKPDGHLLGHAERRENNAGIEDRQRPLPGGRDTLPGFALQLNSEAGEDGGQDSNEFHLRELFPEAGACALRERDEQSLARLPGNVSGTRLHGESVRTCVSSQRWGRKSATSAPQSSGSRCMAIVLNTTGILGGTMYFRSSQSSAIDDASVHLGTPATVG